MTAIRLAEPGDAVILDEDCDLGIGMVVDVSRCGRRAIVEWTLLERRVGVYRDWLEVISTPKDRIWRAVKRLRSPPHRRK